jgi:hypothetical protein
MTHLEYRTAAQQDQSLYVGQPVLVRWGYGLGFRVEGHGTIERLYEKSVRVRLSHDVRINDHVGWNKGFVLQGIPRLIAIERWNTNHCVIPLTAPTRTDKEG